MVIKYSRLPLFFQTQEGNTAPVPGSWVWSYDWFWPMSCEWKWWNVSSHQIIQWPLWDPTHPEPSFNFATVTHVTPSARVSDEHVLEDRPKSLSHYILKLFVITKKNVIRTRKILEVTWFSLTHVKCLCLSTWPGKFRLWLISF